MTTIESVIGIFSSVGLISIVLPFFLLFTILLGLFNRLNLFGEVSRRINIILALALALLGSTVLASPKFFYFWTQGISLIAVGAILLLVLAGFGSGNPELGSGLKKFIFLVMLGALLTAGGAYAVREGLVQIPPYAIAVMLAFGVFVLVLWFLFRPEKKSDDGQGKGTESEKKGKK